MLPALDLFDVICPNSLPPLVREDNQAAIMIVNSGRNPSMRHLKRVQRVDVAWLHERLGVHPDKGRSVISYEDTKNMSADIYTKPFNSAPAWQHALILINISPDKWYDKLVNLISWHETRK